MAGPADTLDAPAGGRLSRSLDWLAAFLPAALVLFFTFQAGGFFPGSTGLAAAALAILLALRTTTAERPFAALTRPAGVAAAALAAYAAWTLISVAWSDAPGRALLEFNRTLLYGLAFVVCATLPFTRRRLALAVRGLTLATYAGCVAGWASRVLPEVIAPRPGASTSRLGYPLTYWNAQGLFAALGTLLAFHLACSEREPRWVRALGAGAVPLLASTLYFTFSRGALLALAAGLVVYLVLFRSRGLLTGALATVPPAVAAVLISYEADRLARGGRVDAQAVAEGHEVAIGVAFCSAIAFVARWAVAHFLDDRLLRVSLPPSARRPARVAGIAALLVVVVGVPLALDAPGYASRQFDRFVEGNKIDNSEDQRRRLLDPGNNGRVDNWRVAWDTFEREPWKGTGAGTYVHEWYQQRELDLKVSDGHSLYLETLSDLGLIGFVTLMAALATILGTAVARSQKRNRPPGRDRSLDAVIVAAMVAWAAQAGLDWMWEMPAVTVWLFALGGIALARRVPSGGSPSPPRGARVAIGLGCLVLAVVPFQVARSQGALNDAVEAFEASPQDCPRAIDAALTSLEAVGARSEPWQLLSFCNLGVGQPQLAVRAARNAVARDPLSWEAHYGLALVLGAAGEDPRRAAARALALNPRSELAGLAVRRFDQGGRRTWPRIARRLQLPE